MQMVSSQPAAIVREELFRGNSLQAEGKRFFGEKRAEEPVLESGKPHQLVLKRRGGSSSVMSLVFQAVNRKLQFRSNIRKGNVR